MNVEQEVAASVRDDREWKERRRLRLAMAFRIGLGIAAAGVLLSTAGAALMGYVRAETLKPVPCLETFEFHVQGSGYAGLSCAHPAHRMTIVEIKKVTEKESGLFSVRCTCDARKAALLTCNPMAPAELERLYQKTVTEPVDAVTP
jgi:hypothetical protein